VIHFINFTFSALLGPVCGSRLVQAAGGDDTMALALYQAAQGLAKPPPASPFAVELVVRRL
jgi:hypothetical protein